MPELPCGLNISNASVQSSGAPVHPHENLPDLNAKYTITSEVLGTGSSAVVKKATRKDNSDVNEIAVKFMKVTGDEGLCDVIQREFHLIKELRHPSIVQAYDLFLAPDRSLAALCMQLVRGSTLKDLVKKQGAIQEDTMRPIFKQLISGLSYLHRKRVMHRDLKPDNLLIEDGLEHLRICDFNVARKLAEGRTLTPLITDKHFSAPEVLLCDAKMGERADIWGAGVCLHYALTGGMTLPGISEIEHLPPRQLGQRLLDITEKQRLRWVEKPGLSWESPAVNVLWGCTHPDAYQRPEPYLLMAHPWLSRIEDVTGQEYKKKHMSHTAEAMETCALRVCSTGFGSNLDDNTMKPPFKAGGGMTSKIDSRGNVIVNSPKEVYEEEKKKTQFWTTPNVEGLDMAEEDLFDTSNLDENLYEVSSVVSPHSSQNHSVANSRSNSRRPSFHAFDVRGLSSPKSLASPKSLESPKSPANPASFCSGDLSPKSTRDRETSLQTVTEAPVCTLASALERMAQGTKSSKRTKEKKKKNDGYPGADDKDMILLSEKREEHDHSSAAH